MQPIVSLPFLSFLDPRSTSRAWIYVNGVPATAAITPAPIPRTLTPMTPQLFRLHLRFPTRLPFWPCHLHRLDSTWSKVMYECRNLDERIFVRSYSCYLIQHY